VKSLLHVYVAVIFLFIVVAWAMSVIARYQGVLPWLVALVVLVIVGRIVWQRTHY